MNTYLCTCGQRLFFDNNGCLRCHAKLGFCPDCRAIVPLQAQADGYYVCGNPSCGTRLTLCRNYSAFNVCNRCVKVPQTGLPDVYCDCCRCNYTIPDLSVAGNWEKWCRLEAAKRRLFYDLDLLGLPRGTQADGFYPPLSFDFKADEISAADVWRTAGDAERVYTGHIHGHITINIREADALERERARVDLGEAHRTLIGHFRHEIGHYYWDVLIRGQREDAFIGVFGNPERPPYAVALERYYQSGPVLGWQQQFVSAYACMHPWEDWAETFAFYLDMASALDTAVHMGFLSGDIRHADTIEKMVATYQQLGIGLNEMSRTLGLLDMVPEIVSQGVCRKLAFIHTLCPPPASL